MAEDHRRSCTSCNLAVHTLLIFGGELNRSRYGSGSMIRSFLGGGRLKDLTLGTNADSTDYCATRRRRGQVEGKARFRAGFTRVRQNGREASTVTAGVPVQLDWQKRIAQKDIKVVTV